MPRGFSPECIDFVNQLIARKKNKRLGINGIDEVMNHPWFRNFSWTRLKRKEMEPPFVPNVKEVFDYLRTLSEDSTHTTEMAEVDLNAKATSKMFQGYEFNNADHNICGLD